MTQRKSDKGLDFETLCLGIERCDPDFVLGFYAEDAELSIVNANAPPASIFELRGKAEIAKHLRAIFGQGASHSVEPTVISGKRETFVETCEYPDGGRVWVETTLEVRDGKIVRQVDVVFAGTQAPREEEISRKTTHSNSPAETSQGVDAPLPDHILRPKQATEKEDPR